MLVRLFQTSHLRWWQIPWYPNRGSTVSCSVNLLGYKRDAYTNCCLHLIDPRAAFAVLKHCINNRPSFLSRVCSHEDMHEYLSHFDSSIDKVLAVLVNEPRPSREFAIIRSLPLRVGGIGLRRHAGMYADKSRLASCHLAQEFIIRHYPKLKSLVLNAWSTHPLCKPLIADSSYAPVLTAATDETCDFDYSTLITDLKLELQANQNDELSRLCHTLCASNRESSAAWLRSSNFKGSGAWTQCTGGSFYGHFEIKKEQFVDALRTRLLLPPCSLKDSFGESFSCSCGKVFNMVTNPLHFLDCPHGKYHSHARHDKVRDTIGDFIRRSCPSFQTTIEPNLQTVDGTAMRADIQVCAANRTFHLDVAIVDPSAPSYTQYGSGMEVNVANEKKEKSKRASYKLRAPELEESSIIPFVIEATGRFGDAALGFIDLITNEHCKDNARTLQFQIGALIANYNALMVSRLRELCRQQTN